MRTFPLTRLRRNRTTDWLRDLIVDTEISTKDLIWPVFVKEGKGEKEPIKSMPGVYRYSIDNLVKEVSEARELGILAIALFPHVGKELKTECAKESFNQGNLICRAVREIKSKVDIGIICDVALDPYTNSGHDGVLDAKGKIDNDPTVEILCKQALAQAEAGCDILAPSDMMDGRVFAIREMLDQEGFINAAILSYAAKYASNFYGPFRDAVGSKSSLSKADKKTYQMDFRRKDEALAEVEIDIAEGADMVMVKPGMPYLDIVSKIKSKFSIPVFAYQVSGEYSMLKIAAEAGCFDFEKTMLESMYSFKRAGASAVLTYGAVEIAKELTKFMENSHE
jgi:porphobilinogen synthase